MENRSVPLLVGSQIYPLITTLDDAKLDVVYKILRDTVAETPPTLAQDQRLFIASIKLADDLVNITRRIEDVLALIETNAEDKEAEEETENNEEEKSKLTEYTEEIVCGEDSDAGGGVRNERY